MTRCRTRCRRGGLGLGRTGCFCCFAAQALLGLLARAPRSYTATADTLRTRRKLTLGLATLPHSAVMQWARHLKAQGYNAAGQGSSEEQR